MESNREEARRALEIARRKKAEGDIAGAIKFANKSQSLFSTPEADEFLAVLADLSSSNGTAYTSGTSTPRNSNADGTTEGSTGSGGGVRERKKAETEHRQGRQNVEYTKEQVTIVERVRKCKHHQYYEILELKTEATDAEIKKSYRRLALQLHPDKNGAPGADEAFKMVSRAFQVLSDADKRAAFDRHGEDPDSRTAGMGGGSPFGNGFGGMRAYNGGGGMYADEISPEDLFNMFFGGGGFGGGGFNASPFTAQFGGPGFRVHTFGGGRGTQFRRPQQQQRQQENSSVLYQLLPVLILLAVTIIPALLNSSASSAPPPSFVFDPQPPYTVQRLTPQHSIPYFLKSDDVSKLSNSKLHQLDQKAEFTFVRGLRDQCQVEYDTRQQRIADAQGWWGQVKDQEKWDAAKTMKLESCERLRVMGYRPEIY